MVIVWCWKALKNGNILATIIYKLDDFGDLYTHLPISTYPYRLYTSIYYIFYNAVGNIIHKRNIFNLVKNIY